MESALLSFSFTYSFSESGKGEESPSPYIYPIIIHDSFSFFNCNLCFFLIHPRITRLPRLRTFGWPRRSDIPLPLAIPWPRPSDIPLPLSIPWPRPSGIPLPLRIPSAFSPASRPPPPAASGSRFPHASGCTGDPKDPSQSFFAV